LKKGDLIWLLRIKDKIGSFNAKHFILSLNKNNSKCGIGKENKSTPCGIKNLPVEYKE